MQKIMSRIRKEDILELPGFFEFVELLGFLEFVWFIWFIWFTGFPERTVFPSFRCLVR